MTPLMALLARFLLAALVIVGAGTALARSGDVIAARTRLGGVWVGSVFLALATSLPEITTDIAAVRLGALNLAAGDLFGSSMANMLILALVNVLPTGVGLFRKAALEHVLYAAVAIILTCVAAVVILLRPTGSVWGIGPGSALLLVVYLAGSRAIYRHSSVVRAATATAEMSVQGTAADASGSAPATLPSLGRAIALFVGASIVILFAAPQFARAADGLAIATGLGTTFIGTWLVGVSTSLPELVTSLAAVRLGAFDLAVGNLFGSNAFNMTILILLDAVQGPGPFLGLVSPVHAISALLAVALMAVAVAALVYRAEGRFRLLEPSSAIMIAGYVLGLVALLLSGQR
jgi:cation:H+ antiporter